MPSGPSSQYTSLIHASLCTLLRPFGAMWRLWGGRFALMRVALHAAPLYGGSEVGAPFAIGVAARAAVAATNTATSSIAHCRARRDRDPYCANLDMLMCWDPRGIVQGITLANIARPAVSLLNRTCQFLVQT